MVLVLHGEVKTVKMLSFGCRIKQKLLSWLHRKIRRSKNYCRGFIGKSEEAKTAVVASSENPKRQKLLSQLHRKIRRSKINCRGFVGKSEETKSVVGALSENPKKQNLFKNICLINTILMCFIFFNTVYYQFFKIHKIILFQKTN